MGSAFLHSASSVLINRHFHEHFKIEFTLVKVIEGLAFYNSYSPNCPIRLSSPLPFSGISDYFQDGVSKPFLYPDNCGQFSATSLRYWELNVG